MDHPTDPKKQTHRNPQSFKCFIQEDPGCLYWDSCLRIRREVRRNSKHEGVGSVHLTGNTALRTHHTSPTQNVRQLQFGFQVYTTEPRTAEASCGCSFLGVRFMFRLKVYALCCTAGSTKRCLGPFSDTVPQGDPQQKQYTDVYIGGPKAL